ncbi:restriction endonuclease subunit S [Aeromonas veronii]|uniref:restriction endonuclease subunit S n=1 Tax=Aeromonas veronii TaxID=654 RepID=UPI0038D2C7C6
MSEAAVTSQQGLVGKYQPYPEYKDLGAEWLDEIPVHWKLHSLKFALEMRITDGPHETPEFLDEGIPFVSAEAVSKGFIDFDKIRGHISDDDNRKYSRKYSPRRHDIFMVKSGATTGITAIVDTDQKFNIWSPLAVMRPSQNFEPYYLLNYLRSSYFQDSVALSWSFGTQQNIGMGILENLSICRPPMEEQRTIAAFLDYETTQIERLIAQQQRLIELLKEKRQAVIFHSVTKGLNPNAYMKDSGLEWLGQVPGHWDVLPVKHIAKFVGTGGTPKEDHSFSESADICWFTPGDFKGDLKLTVSKKHITKLSVQTKDAKVYTAGSVLVIGIGATLGKVALCEFEFSCNQQINVIQPNERAEPLFLAYSLSSQVEQMKLLSNASTIGIMNQEKTKQVTLAIPHLEEQQEIIRYLDESSQKFARLLAKSESQILLLQERRTALISAAVTGKIDLRGWTPPTEEAAL